MKFIRIIAKIFIFCVLTILTQIGGVIYILSLLIHQYIENKTQNKFLRSLLKTTVFLVLYLTATLFIVPFIAKPFGRVALPLTKTENLQPLNIMTCLLNRHYVKPVMKQTVIEVTNQLNELYPNTTLNYLDANFPFIDNFPLFPHLSHNDGKKLDLSFFYLDSKTGQKTDECPSFVGYGICEEPISTEINTPELCNNRGYWQYSFMRKIIPQGAKADYLFDSERTKAVVNLFASKKTIAKIFIEPHLQTRLGLTNNKVRFHGCQAVRHDDHIHIQLY